MNFLELLDGAEYLAQQGNPHIAGLDYDSRRVKPGWCFVAMRGETTDGNRYIDAALKRRSRRRRQRFFAAAARCARGRRFRMDGARWRG